MHPAVLGERGRLLVQMDLPGSAPIWQAKALPVLGFLNDETCLLTPLRKSAYFMPVRLEILNFKRRGHLKLGNLVLCYAWEDERVGLIKSYFVHLSYLGPVMLLSQCILQVPPQGVVGVAAVSGTARRQAFPFPRAPWLPWKGCNRWLRLSGLPLSVMVTIIWETCHDQLCPVALSGSSQCSQNILHMSLQVLILNQAPSIIKILWVVSNYNQEIFSLLLLSISSFTLLPLFLPKCLSSSFVGGLLYTLVNVRDTILQTRQDIRQTT